jgi:branched-chain amino acid transport system permease protein
VPDPLNTRDRPDSRESRDSRDNRPSEAAVDAVGSDAVSAARVAPRAPLATLAALAARHAGTPSSGGLPGSVIAAGCILFFLIPVFFRMAGLASAPYWLDVLNTVGLYAILALSLNVILGHAGMFHMGHAAFFAVGAYVTAVLNLDCGWPVLWTLPVAGLAAGLFAAVVAGPIIHLRGDYLLIVTIGIVEIIRIALTNDVFGLTGGPNGRMGIARPSVFGFRITRPQHFFYLIWLGVAVSLLMFRSLERSRFGRALKFIKEDPVAAEGIGINTSRHKLLAFVIGAVWAGFAGTLYAARMRTISPDSFNFSESVLLFTIVILGGSGSQRGVLLGSFLIMGLPELFRGFQESRLLVFGAALVVMMIFRPQGLLPPKPRVYALPRPWDSIPGGGGGEREGAFDGNGGNGNGGNGNNGGTNSEGGDNDSARAVSPEAAGDPAGLSGTSATSTASAASTESSTASASSTASGPDGTPGGSSGREG